MDDKTFNTNKGALNYLEENMKNYYFKKRYQRYNPTADAIEAFRNVSKKTNVLVLATKGCPICIATIPALLRLHFDVQNPLIDIRVVEDSSPTLPSFLESKNSPFIIFYDESFNELFCLEQLDIKNNLENSIVEGLGNNL